MEFEKGFTYHVFNQGNNRKRIFYSRANYFFFIRKIIIHIKPYANIISYCLMPNHFHLLLEIKHSGLYVADEFNGSEQVLMKGKRRSINSSIGVMLRSYTRAINNSQGRTGVLFRPKTKAVCVDCFDGPSPLFYNVNGVKQINMSVEKTYKDNCIDYIDENPVKAGLAFKKGEWEFSSAFEKKNKVFRLLN